MVCRVRRRAGQVLDVNNVDFSLYHTFVPFAPSKCGPSFSPEMFIVVKVFYIALTVSMKYVARSGSGKNGYFYFLNGIRSLDGKIV